jgi:hypothetical protein
MLLLRVEILKKNNGYLHMKFLMNNCCGNVSLPKLK